MILRNLLIPCLFPLFFSLSAQSDTLNIHSVTIDRQPVGETGYTLNGAAMFDYSRQKLLNPINFGDTGVFPKSISITDAYGFAGDLAEISTIPDIDLFYFGSFNIPDFPDQPFLAEEIDSLYQWSVDGGKMIIAGSSSAPDYGIDFRVLNSRWDFSIELIAGPYDPTLNIPTIAGATLFDGPFGDVVEVGQGGFGQGFFDTLPPNSVVLAVSQDEQPVILLDCTTLDLILADGDTHNMLGGVSVGGDINNPSDQFWANTIAFMDQLEDPPFISRNGGTLSLNEEYNAHQWNLDGNPVQDATANTFDPSEAGMYSVTVELDEGCILTSPEFAFIPSNVNELKEIVEFTVFPNPASTYSQINLDLKESTILKIDLVDLLGRQVQAITPSQKFYSGQHKITFSTSNIPSGTYSVVLQSQKGVRQERLVVR